MAIGRLVPEQIVKQPGWPDKWDEASLELELASIGLRSFKRGYCLEPQSDYDLVFPHFQEGSVYQYGVDWRSISDEHNDNYDPISPFYVDPEWTRYVGCDIAGKNRRGTVIFILAISPSGVRHILDIRMGAWTAPEFVRQLEVVNDIELLCPRIINVESNYEASVSEWVREKGSPISTKIVASYTGKNKLDPEIGLPGIDLQYSSNRWKLGIPHLRGVPTEPDPKDRTACICGRCMFVYAAHTVTKDDIDTHNGTPDTIMAQWIAKEASRQGEKFSDTSVSVVRVSAQSAKALAAAKIKALPRNLPVALGGKSQKRGSFDFGRQQKGLSYIPFECTSCQQVCNLQTASQLTDGRIIGECCIGKTS